MINRIVAVSIYWGIWLILPFLVDGLASMVQLVQVALRRLQVRRQHLTSPSYQARLTVIVPVYNGEKTLGPCLASLHKQNYPHHLIEIIVVDNGSTDGTAQVYQEAGNGSFKGQMYYVSISGRGKPYALNAGLHLSNAPYICNVDADTLLDPDALAEMVRRFEQDPQLNCATGAVEVLPIDEEVRRKDWIAFWIAECEYQEYLSSFWLGRQGESVSDSLFTLAGAFSFFRRDVLLRTGMYDKMTVSEDTKVTFDIRQQFGDRGIVCIPEAVAYVTPTPSLQALYAQRVRWQRGELEVAALHQEMVSDGWMRMRGLALGRTLLIDHTFLFPRLTWTFLFPALAIWGYPLDLIMFAWLLIYFFYVFIAFISSLAISCIVDIDIRARLWKNTWIILTIPLYRMMIFFFRLSGSLIALTEPAEWRVQDPITALISIWSDVIAKCRKNPFRIFIK